MTKPRIFFKEIEDWLVPKPTLGGLVIEDAAIYYLEVCRDKSSVKTKASLRLPPGIIETGRIKDRPNFVAAMKELRSQIGQTQEVVSVVLSLPIQAVYIQSFYVPAFAERDLVEAAELNLKMISPIESSEAYSDWQRIGSRMNSDGRIELLGAFVEKKLVDEFAGALEEANYGVAAVECQSFSLLRSFLEKEKNFAESELLVSLSSGGVNYLIAEEGRLFFHYFSPWLTGEKTIELSPVKIESQLSDRIQQIVNFYLGHAGKNLKRMEMITSQLGPELTAALSASFPGTEVRVISPAEVNAPIGAAVRFCSTDGSEIDLGGVTSFRLYEEERIINFSYFWRNTAMIFTAVVLTLYLGSYFFLTGFSRNFSSSAVNPAISSSLASLQNQAANFNGLIAANKKAAASLSRLSPLLAKLQSLAGSGLAFTSISVQGSNQPVSVTGTAATQAAILNFRDGLAKLPQIANLNLPLSSLLPQPDGTISFSLSFTPTNLNF
ncbi:MAG TPA: hypothetical protein VMU70_00705 [Candidatus Tyrphobacter sp.]|nr:hypothetical protein [Candidatus Tyrphobacter sp.]